MSDRYRQSNASENARRVVEDHLSGSRTFIGAFLPEVDIEGAALSGSDFFEAKCWRIEANCADLGWSAFNDAFLVEGDFIGASLVSSDMRGANLRAANFTGADLRGARLASTCHSLGERVWAFDFTTKFPLAEPEKLEGATIDDVPFFQALEFLRGLGPEVTPTEGQLLLLAYGHSDRDVIDLRPSPVRA